MSSEAHAGETAARDSDRIEEASSFQSSEGTVFVPSTPSRSDENESSEDETRSVADAADRDADEREKALSAEDLQSRLRASRRAEKALNRELERYREAEQARESANKTELERALERAEAAEKKAATLERSMNARSIAAEFGIADWADELAKDADEREMRAHATKIRERLSPASPGMDGGVRSLGVTPHPSSMDDLIRGGTRR